MIVSDGDISNNAAYDLVLENVENAEGVFSVYPEKAVGRTPVIIRVANPDRLDELIGKSDDEITLKDILQGMRETRDSILSRLSVLENRLD